MNEKKVFGKLEKEKNLVDENGLDGVHVLWGGDGEAAGGDSEHFL